MIRTIRKGERNYQGDSVRLLSMRTSGSLHLGMDLMCFHERGSSQKRHSFGEGGGRWGRRCWCEWLAREREREKERKNECERNEQGSKASVQEIATPEEDT